jgi:hypothetical protein
MVRSDFIRVVVQTSTSTFTRDSSNVTSVVISSDVGLTVTLVEGDSFELSVSFYGHVTEHAHTHAHTHAGSGLSDPHDSLRAR